MQQLSHQQQKEEEEDHYYDFSYCERDCVSFPIIIIIKGDNKGSGCHK